MCSETMPAYECALDVQEHVGEGDPLRGRAIRLRSNPLRGFAPTGSIPIAHGRHQVVGLPPSVFAHHPGQVRPRG